MRKMTPLLIKAYAKANPFFLRAALSSDTSLPAYRKFLRSFKVASEMRSRFFGVYAVLLAGYLVRLKIATLFKRGRLSEARTLHQNKMDIWTELAGSIQELACSIAILILCSLSFLALSLFQPPPPTSIYDHLFLLVAGLLCLITLVSYFPAIAALGCRGLGQAIAQRPHTWDAFLGYVIRGEAGAQALTDRSAQYEHDRHSHAGHRLQLLRLRLLYIRDVCLVVINLLYEHFHDALIWPLQLLGFKVGQNDFD